MIKKIVIVFFALLTLLLALFLGAAWYIYKNQDLIRDEIVVFLNQQQLGTTVIDEVKIKPFRNFPYISVDLKGLRFYGGQEARGVPIYEVDDAYIGFDVYRLYQGDFVIRKVLVEGGFMHLIHFENGDLNLQLAVAGKEDRENEEAQDFNFSIQEVVIRDFLLIKENQQNQNLFQFKIPELRSRFSYSSQFIEADLEADLFMEDLSLDGFTFFRDKRLRLESSGIYDQEKKSITFSPSTLRVESGAFVFDGFMDVSEKFFMDLMISGEKSDFSLVSAFAPPDLYEAFSSYQTEGEIFLEGRVRGFATDSISPRIDIDFGCKNASFLHPDRQVNIRDLSFRGYFTNGSEKNLRTTEIKIENLTFRPEKSILKGNFHAINFYEPTIFIDLTTRIDLETIANFYDFSEIGSFKGQLEMDLSFNRLINLDSIENNPGIIQDAIVSRIESKRIELNAEGLPKPIREIDFLMNLDGGNFNIERFSAKMGDSNLRLKGRSSSLAPFFTGKDDSVFMQVAVGSELIDLADFQFDAQNNETPPEKIKDLSFHLTLNSTVEELKNFDFYPSGFLNVKQFTASFENYHHHIQDLNLRARLFSDSIRLSLLHGKIDTSDFMLQGGIKNAHVFLHDSLNAWVSGQITFQSQYFTLEDVFTYRGKNYVPEEYQQETARELGLQVVFGLDKGSLDRLPEKLPDFDLELKRLNTFLRYHPLRFRNIEAKLSARNDFLNIHHMRGAIGKSDFSIQGKMEHPLDSINNKEFLHLVSKNLDIDELINWDEDAESAQRDEAWTLFQYPFPNMEVTAQIGKMNYHKFQINNLYGHLRSQRDQYIFIDTLSLGASGGSMGLKGYFNASDPENIYLQSDCKVLGIRMEEMLYKFDNFGQDVLLSENLKGILTADIHSRARVLPDLSVDLPATTATINATIKDGELIDFAPMEALSRFMSDRNLKNIRFGQLENTVELRDGIIYIPRMEISSTLGYLYVSGQNSLDLNMEYNLSIPLSLVKGAVWNSLFRRQNRSMPGEDEEIVSATGKRLRNYLNIHITGTPEDFEVGLGRRRN